MLTCVTSCGGTSNETVLRSTFLYESTHGMTKNNPGPLAPPDLKRPNRKTTALSYSCTTYKIINVLFWGGRSDGLGIKGWKYDKSKGDKIRFLTLTVTQSENGIVTKTRTKENIVRSIAHTPGPSGSARK